jgi:hypothetical protein
MTYASLLFREGKSKEDVDATLAKLELPAQANWWWSALKKQRY